ncbi:hypothetical protein [Paenibacillus sp. YYML68]|uniref:hypothetical protein n=1 Tax=Paenibacillus sp. YYML68 TaxID=2909250 RepID=UPI002491125D|nr:hypothetical protein [Paenibacillus sp. YYML68]
MRNKRSMIAVMMAMTLLAGCTWWGNEAEQGNGAAGGSQQEKPSHEAGTPPDAAKPGSSGDQPPKNGGTGDAGGANSGSDGRTGGADPKPAPGGSAAPADGADKQPAVWTPEQAKAIIAKQADDVVAAWKAKDMAKLQSYAHPEKGIRFSPDTHVDTKVDQVVKPDELKSLLGDKKKRVWGEHDGSGAPIELTFAEYYDQYVYKHDYAKAEKKAYNETVGKGNTVNNIREVYPKAVVAEYHFSGFDPKFEGMDWASLRLVFETHDNVWKLVAIVNDRWSI